MLEGLGDKKRLAEVNRILKNGWFYRGGLACVAMHPVGIFYSKFPSLNVN